MVTYAPSSPEKQDGRHLRRERSRRAVTEAVLPLIRETGRLPSVDEVAARAGVTERTVFNLFPDTTALMLAGVQAFREEALGRLPAVPDASTLEQRLERYVRRLEPFLEDYSRIRWAALTARAHIPDMDRGVVLEASFRRLTDVLARDGIEIDQDSATAAALRAAVDPMTWRLYRVQQRLSAGAARSALLRSILSLAKASNDAP